MTSSDDVLLQPIINERTARTARDAKRTGRDPAIVRCSATRGSYSDWRSPGCRRNLPSSPALDGPVEKAASASPPEVRWVRK